MFQVGNTFQLVSVAAHISLSVNQHQGDFFYKCIALSISKATVMRFWDAGTQPNLDKYINTRLHIELVVLQNNRCLSTHFGVRKIQMSLNATSN